MRLGKLKTELPVLRHEYPNWHGEYRGLKFEITLSAQEERDSLGDLRYPLYARFYTGEGETRDSHTVTFPSIVMAGLRDCYYRPRKSVRFWFFPFYWHVFDQTQEQMLMSVVIQTMEAIEGWSHTMSAHEMTFLEVAKDVGSTPTVADQGAFALALEVTGEVLSGVVEAVADAVSD